MLAKERRISTTARSSLELVLTQMKEMETNVSQGRADRVRVEMGVATVTRTAAELRTEKKEAERAERTRELVAREKLEEIEKMRSGGQKQLDVFFRGLKKTEKARDKAYTARVEELKKKEKAQDKAYTARMEEVEATGERVRALEEKLEQVLEKHQQHQQQHQRQQQQRRQRQQQRQHQHQQHQP